MAIYSWGVLPFTYHVQQDMVWCLPVPPAFPLPLHSHQYITHLVSCYFCCERFRYGWLSGSSSWTEQCQSQPIPCESQGLPNGRCLLYHILQLIRGPGNEARLYHTLPHQGTLCHSWLHFVTLMSRLSLVLRPSIPSFLQVWARD